MPVYICCRVFLITDFRLSSILFGMTENGIDGNRVIPAQTSLHAIMVFRNRVRHAPPSSTAPSDVDSRLFVRDVACLNHLLRPNLGCAQSAPEHVRRHHYDSKSFPILPAHRHCARVRYAFSTNLDLFLEVPLVQTVLNLTIV